MDELLFYWKTGREYDYGRRGITLTFEQNADSKKEELRQLYGDLI